MGAVLSKTIGNTSDRKQRSITMEIDAQLHREKTVKKSEHKLLLLGAAESGKSTILKQMRILNDQGFTEIEIKHQKLVIHSNIILSMTSIIQASSLFGIAFNDTSTEVCAALVMLSAKDHRDVEFSPELQRALIKLWNNEGIRRAFARANEFQLNDSVEYYFNQLDRIGSEDYVPTTEDILHSRIQTTGVVELMFSVKNVNLRVVDVGGQRSERRKWIHCFDDALGIIFVTSLNEYDQTLAEEESTNRMHESLRLFAYICNHDCFINTAIMLFLNKRDLFEQKITRVPLTLAFPDYQGEQSYAGALAFIQKKFRALNSNPHKALYSHETCATNTDQMKFVLDSCFEIILSKNVEKLGVV